MQEGGKWEGRMFAIIIFIDLSTWIPSAVKLLWHLIKIIQGKNTSFSVVPPPLSTPPQLSSPVSFRPLPPTSAGLGYLKQEVSEGKTLPLAKDLISWSLQPWIWDSPAPSWLAGDPRQVTGSLQVLVALPGKFGNKLNMECPNIEPAVLDWILLRERGMPSTPFPEDLVPEFISDLRHLSTKGTPMLLFLVVFILPLLNSLWNNIQPIMQRGKTEVLNGKYCFLAFPAKYLPDTLNP